MRWRPDPPMPNRTDGEALSRALEVAGLAARDPDRFAQLARTYSDDLVTRDAGGSLGGVRAGQLPSEYRDALAVLKPGETSRVLRTALGYCVLKRRPPPPEGQVAGKRIVVRYTGTVGGPRGVESPRPRETALELARELAEQAKSGATSFDTLVNEYSENVDAAQSGDMGVWSVRDPGFIPREVERLDGLRVGEVAPPMDSVFGFEILLRTEANERPRYAMTAVQIQYDPNLAENEEHSRAGALRLATDLSRKLHIDPSQFDRLQLQYCCGGVQQWTLGRGPVGVSAALDQLAFGEIADKPVEANWSYFIAKRIDPSTLGEPPPPRYELPNPHGPDLDALVRDSDGSSLAEYTRVLSTEVRKLLALPGAETQEVSRQLDQLASSFEKNEADPVARLESMRVTLSRLKEQLGPKDYGVFDAFVSDWTTRMFLGGQFRRSPIAAAGPRQPL
jgi:hypothetical protein